MIPHRFGHIPHYFRKQLPKPLHELYVSAAIMDLAASAIALFEPIYLWTLGYGIREIMVFYLIVYGAYFLLVPLGGLVVARYGHERSILISTFCYAAYFAALIGIGSLPWLFFVAPFLFALQKSFYWPAYHFDFMRFAIRQERGQEFSGIWAESTLMYTIGPVIGGVLVTLFGFPTLFGLAIVCILLSSTPLFGARVQPKHEPFSYRQSFLLPFRRRYRRNSLAYLSLGHEHILLTVWPIFIFIVFGNLFNVGVLVGLSSLLSAASILIVGKLTDRLPKARLARFSGLASAGVWMLRILVRWPPAVFLLDLVGRLTHNAGIVSVTTLTYDRAHDDDYSWHGVYYEQGYALGKSLMSLLVIAVASAADPFSAAFLLAAAVSFFALAY